MDNSDSCPLAWVYHIQALHMCEFMFWAQLIVLTAKSRIKAICVCVRLRVRVHVCECDRWVKNWKWRSIHHTQTIVDGISECICLCVRINTSKQHMSSTMATECISNWTFHNYSNMCNICCCAKWMAAYWTFELVELNVSGDIPVLHRKRTTMMSLKKSMKKFKVFVIR